MVQIVADVAQVQQVADALGMPVETARAMFAAACQDGTTDAVRQYVRSRMGPTYEEIEANAVPGKTLDSTLVQVIVAAGQAGGWFYTFDVNPAVQP